MSIIENCETLIEQTHTKVHQKIESELTKPSDTFSFTPSINRCFDFKWIFGLTSLEVYNSILNIKPEINKLEVNTDTFEEFSFSEIKKCFRVSLSQKLHPNFYNME